MRKNRTISMIILAIFLFSMFPAYEAQAADDLNIISTSGTITKDDAKLWATKKGATQTFIGLADLYWKYYKTNGNVNPAIAYVQAAKETGFGKFGGVIDESFHNPCGLKTSSGGDNSDPNAHKRFNSWDEGVQAHLDHLALYAGGSGYPRTKTFDPRHFASIFGIAKTVKSLSGKWAPSTTYGDEILSYYGELDTVSKNKQALVSIETPINNDNALNSTLMISGWALNTYGVKDIKIYVDGSYILSAQRGISRTDVDQKYPGYLNGDKSGYNATIDLSKISQGKRTITVEAIGNNGVSVKQTTVVNVVKKAPRITIDSPVSGSTINQNTMSIKGWALNASGVKQVRVYIDGKLISNAQTGISRPDVNAAIPGYPNGDKSGYAASIDITQVAPGQRLIALEAVGNDGTSISSSIKVNVVKKSPRIAIDSPTNGTTVNNNSIKIQGWALNASGVKEVKVYVDGKFIVNAQTGISRPDVNAAIPGYPNGDKGGYSGSLDLTNIAPGQRTVTMQAVGNDGTSISSDIKLNVVKKSPIIAIDTPTNGSAISTSSLKVQGWALNASGVKEIKVYIDGKLIGNAQIGISRPDVNAAIPGYPNGDKSGYTANVDLTAIAQGQRTINIQAVGNDGTSISKIITISVVKKEARLIIDTPTNNSSVRGDTLKVEGWALNGSGVKEVKVYVDGNLIGNAQTGISRPDVNAALPGYPNGDKSGYTTTIDLTKLAKGNRNISVQSVGFDGSVMISSVNITISDHVLIVVDPGHNFGGDDGAYSSDKNYSERELNMQVAVKLQARLQGLGYDVVMTRQPWEKPMDDLRTSLKNRTDLANNLKADLFISLHHNSSPSPVSNGMAVYYSTYKPGLKNVQADLVPLTSGYDGYTDINPTNAAITSRTFAKNVEEALTSKCGYSKTDSDAGRLGYIDRNLSVTVNTNMPSVLIELGFISNPTEAARCADQNEQQNKANVIADEVNKMF